MIELCHFDKPGRANAPINNPQQWRYLSKILEDKDIQKKSEMLKRIIEDKEKPNIVWAQRSEELSKPQWDKWLKKVCNVLNLITLSDDLDSEEAKRVTKKLQLLIEQLEQKDG